VLLVEDDAAVRNATEMLLKVGGYKVTAVASRKEALGVAAEQGDIDVVVTDFHLEGGETGTQVISSLRDVLGGRFKAVLMTGDTSSAIKDLNRDVLLRVASKPINADAFLAMLEELLSV
jgi:two-component system CheB/CheR fusion protein